MNHNDELTTTAMQIILNAGDARRYIEQAFDKALENDFESAESLTKQSEDLIRKAHQSQTTVIQSNAAGVKYELSILFIHAQDTLMTIVSEINVTKRLIEILRLIHGNKTNTKE